MQYKIPEGSNTCDKCGAVCVSTDLVWIKTEDFTPKENEEVDWSLCGSFDALCEGCYQSILKK